MRLISFSLVFTMFLLLSSINSIDNSINTIDEADPSSGISEIDSGPRLQSISTIVHDGIVSIDEYDYSSSFEDGEFKLYYTINRSTIYIAIQGRALGYVAIGFEYQDDMLNSDIIVGYFDDLTNSTVSFDAFGTTKKGTPPPDAEQNILSSAASQDQTYTTLEFSRLLNTGDTVGDREIIPGKQMGIIWAYHDRDVYELHEEADEEKNFVFYGPPSAPTELTSDANRNQVELSWTSSKGDGGFPLLNYNIYRSLAGQAYEIVGTTLTNNFIDSGVETGNSYSYYISAENSRGESGESNGVEVVTIDVMSEPRSLTATNSTGSVVLSWLPPLDDGGIPITNYNIFRADDPIGPFNFLSNTTAISYTDNAVTNGYRYYYTVNAENNIISSSSSNQAGGYPVGESTPPVNLLTQFGDGEVSLSWEAPLSDGGFSILSYNVYRSGEDKNFQLIANNLTETTMIDYDVINSNTYFYKITATNTFGESDGSMEQRITLANVPGTPQNISAVSGNSTIIISWELADGKGYEIIYYSIYRSRSSENVFELIDTTNATEFEDFGVINGIAYTYFITATNEIGESSYSQSIQLTPATVPSKPGNLLLVKSDASMFKIRWEVPLNNGGLSVSVFNVYRASELDPNFTLIGESFNREYIDHDIQSNIKYYYAVTAVNNKGESEMSNEIEVITGSSPVGTLDLQVEIQNQQISLSWQVELSDVLEYRIYRSPVSGEPYILIDTAINTSYIDSSVSLGSSYYYVVTGLNAIGESEYSNEVNVSFVTKPSEPQNLLAFGGNGQVLIIWDTPVTEGGVIVENYNIYRKTVGDLEYSLLQVIYGISWIDESVENDVEYMYKISATNSVGESEFSNEVSTTPTQTEVTFEFEEIENLDELNDTEYEIISTIDPDDFNIGDIPAGAAVVVVTSGAATIIYVVKKK